MSGLASVASLPASLPELDPSAFCNRTGATEKPSAARIERAVRAAWCTDT